MAFAENVTNRIGEMITIPASTFLMGSNPGDPYAGADEQPQHPVYVPTFQIGKYQVTRGEYRKFLEAGGYQDRRYWSAEGWTWKEGGTVAFTGDHNKVDRVARPNPDKPRVEPLYWAAEQDWGTGLFTQTDLHPVVGVTYYEAEAYCKWAGARLPTEAEWEKAARWTGTHSNIWPWGDTWDPKKCNNSPIHRPARGGVNKLQSSPVGSFPDGASPCGCMDMVGNGWEWVSDWAVSYAGSPASFDHTNAFRFVRGGCWDDDAGPCRCAFREWYLPPDSTGTGPGDCDYVGFRIAR